MSIIDLMIMTIIFLFFIIIVYYFNKKEYRKYSDINTIFFIGMGILFFISIALSFLSIKQEYLIYTYIMSTTAALLVNYSLNKYLLNKSNKFWPLLHLIYLFSILVLLQYNNWGNYIEVLSKLLIVTYFLDIGYLVTKSKKINNLHKMFFSTTFILWSIYEFLAIFFSNDLLYLLGLIFPIAIAYEFMNIQLELINEEIKRYGERFKSIFDNASDAFFVLAKDDLRLMNLNKSAREIFNIDSDHLDKIKLEDILTEDSYKKLSDLIKKGKKSNGYPIELRAESDKGELKYLATDINFMDFNEKNAVIIAMKDKTEQIKLKNKVMENKNKIEKLHDVAIKMENTAKREEIYKQTVEAAEEILDYDVISLDIVKDNKLMAVGKSQNLTDDDVISMSLDEMSLATKAYHEQRTIICNNIPAERDASPVKTQYKSALTVPIQQYGTFQIISEEYDYFTNQDKNLVELLISHSGAALKRLNREEEIRYFGFHDYLTGLYNRDYIEEEIKRLNNSRQLPVSVIIADVNGLKLINDTFGHDDGDKLLKCIAATLDDACRKEDILGRWGGDEFLILLPGTTKKNILSIIDRIKDRLEQKTYKDIPLSVSFGFATKVEKETDIVDIIDKADRRMYNNKTKNYKQNSEQMLEVLYKKLNKMGYETESHCQRVKSLAEKFARQLKFDQEKIKLIKKTARLHDIGMINIPRELINQESDLSNEEYKIIQTHPEVGFRIANSLNEVNEIAQAILHHHEWWNGTGYPEQKAGDNIPLYARIISIVDAFDVMTHDQVYKEKISKERAIDRLRSMAGIQFDPKLTKMFIEEVI
ncbi:MAG TPA: HD domain-containing phosphohydrolase [Halanaerobiales bacterium]|nr:HD domain-containing phosphohydrolase [Halanaerobiales bacterium]